MLSVETSGRMGRPYQLSLWIMAQIILNLIDSAEFVGHHEKRRDLRTGPKNPGPKRKRVCIIIGIYSQMCNRRISVEPNRCLDF
jgi:hypothetical protein